MDIYFLHNPETQLTKIGYEVFIKKLEGIFELFEDKVQEGKMKAYGLAVWNAFTYEPTNPEYISIEDVYDVACRVAGSNHHFKYLQMPFNLAKTNAYSVANQKMSDGKLYTPLHVAYKLGLGVISSSSLLQMNLFKKAFKPEVGYVLDKEMVLKSDVDLALQFVRSTKGIVASLFSSHEPDHVTCNVSITKIAATKSATYNLLYQLEKTS